MKKHGLTPKRSLLAILVLSLSMSGCMSSDPNAPSAGDDTPPDSGTTPPDNSGDDPGDTVGDDSRCDAIKDSVYETGLSGVTVTCDSNYAYVTSSTYPDHDLMNGITGTNEQIPVPAVNYSAPVKLSPAFADNLTSIDAAVGVAVNGVPIYDYSAQGELDIYNYDPNTDTVLLGQLDNCGGHAGRGDDYHYHAAPTCMIDAMANKGDGAILGWGYDGYPLYGNNNPDGTEIQQGDLDVCNGQLDDTFGYRYHTSDSAPYIIQCLVGEVDTGILPRVSPLSGDTTGMRANLTPPQGGVQNLTHTINGTTRTMSYDWQGQSYYVTYTPSATQQNCYDFEQKTVSNGGVVETGTLCRESNGAPPPSDDSGDDDSGLKTATLSTQAAATYGNALAQQVQNGDGAGIDTTFRNSGTLINESSGTYFAVNGVHPVNQGVYDAYYPKSIVEASLDSDTIVNAWPFSSVLGHDVDMEALTKGPEDGVIYIGDEYNYIYEMSLGSGDILREWDLADVGISTNTDKGIEALAYSDATGYFYAGIQELQSILVLNVSLNSGETFSKVSEIDMPLGWSPSGLFAHSDGTLYVLAMNGGNQMIYRYSSAGNLMCEVTIPQGLGITRPDGLYIDSANQYAYIADSQGPIYGGSSLYKVAWNSPCD